jgi:hypothetical protein
MPHAAARRLRAACSICRSFGKPVQCSQVSRQSDDLVRGEGAHPALRNFVDWPIMQMPSWQAVKPLPTQRVLRKYPRHLLSVPVTVHKISGCRALQAHGLTLDLSHGGVSAVLCGAVRVAQTVWLELQLPNRTLHTLAIVRHASRCRCGFEFLSPGHDFDDGIAKCIQRLVR